jgi:hypothetical protein
MKVFKGFLNIIFIIIIFIFLHYKKISKKMKYHNFKADIIINPCGFYGLYTLGICHYIKEHFILNNKKIAGVSSGGLNAFYLCLKKKESRKILKNLLSIPYQNIIDYGEILFNHMEEINFKKLNVKNLYIGLSHIRNLVFYSNFKNIQDVIKCCLGSCFVPKLTNRKMIYTYNKSFTVDGGLWYNKYKNYINKEETLVISTSMFQRYNLNPLQSILYNKNIDTKKLYLQGYSDAKKNHDYFKKYLQEI